VTSSKIENTKDELPKAAADAATGPFLRVIETGGGVISEASTKNDIVALDAFLERGTYPIFLANATTFSLKVALSINASFATMFALYEVM
jgi:hypothetical protein